MHLNAVLCRRGVNFGLRELLFSGNLDVLAVNVAKTEGVF